MIKILIKQQQALPDALGWVVFWLLYLDGHYETSFTHADIIDDNDKNLIKQQQALPNALGGVVCWLWYPCDHY